MMLGIGMALIAVAAYHLIPAVLTGEIPTTTSRRIRRSEAEFRGACVVFSIAGLMGLSLVLASLLRWAFF
jgi:hypothetical protein